MVSPSLPQDLENQLGAALRDEIDREMLDTLREHDLLGQGWHRVPATGRAVDLPGVELDDWLAARCLGGYRRLDGRVMLELRDDAVAFSMVWL